MNSDKRLRLRREMLTDLNADELVGVAGATGYTFTCGHSCGGVCVDTRSLVNCTNTCPVTSTCPAILDLTQAVCS